MIDALRGGEKVEILINGEWVPARFVASDSDPTGEIYWCDYFLTEDFEAFPEPSDFHSDPPVWRPRQPFDLSLVRQHGDETQ